VCVARGCVCVSVGVSVGVCLLGVSGDEEVQYSIATQKAEEDRIAAQIAAGDAAVQQAKDAIAKGDMAAAWAAQEKAVAEYTLANAGKKLVEVAGLSDAIAAAELEARKAGFKMQGDAAYKAAEEAIKNDDLDAARAAQQSAAAFYDKAELDVSDALKDMSARIKAAEGSLALKQKLAAKMANKEQKRRENEKRAAEEAARIEAQRQEVIERDRAKREAVKAKEQRERELLNKAFSTTTLRRAAEPVPELKVVQPPKVSTGALELAKKTGAELAAEKEAAIKAEKEAETERKRLAKVESDRVRKEAENEGDRLFAAAEACLVNGDVDGAKANEKAAAAAYKSQNIARSTTLRQLNGKINEAAKKQAAQRKEDARIEAVRKAEEEAARIAEEKRVAQMKALKEQAARAAEIQAKSGVKVPFFAASQMAGSAAAAPVAPSGPPKLSPELREAAQVTGGELAAAKRREMEAAKKAAAAEAKAAAEQTKKTVDTLVAAGNALMEQSKQLLDGLQFTEARAARDKAAAAYQQAGVNRGASLKNLDMDISKSEKMNKAAAAAAEKKRIADAAAVEKKRIADEKVAAEAAALAKAEAAQKAEVQKQVQQFQVAAEKQKELAAKGGVKVPMFMARQLAATTSMPALKSPPRGGSATIERPVEASPASVAAPAASVETPPLRQAPPASVSSAAQQSAAKSAAKALDDMPVVDWAAKLDALKKSATERLSA